jgi:ATP-dependent Lhr-like helicase
MTEIDPVLPKKFTMWFQQKGWSPHRHQLEMLAADRQESHALLIAPTGGGKTLAGFLPSLIDLATHPTEGLHTLYISPLKALAVDIQRNLMTPVEEMGLDIRIETRTGDTTASRRQRQRETPPQILLTTPESLGLLISQPESFALFATVQRVILDEVHAIAGTKRGDQLALCLARLSKITPTLRRIGLSATVAWPDDLRAYISPRSPGRARYRLLPPWRSTG